MSAGPRSSRRARRRPPVQCTPSSRASSRAHWRGSPPRPVAPRADHGKPRGRQLRDRVDSRTAPGWRRARATWSRHPDPRPPSVQQQQPERPLVAHRTGHSWASRSRKRPRFRRRCPDRRTRCAPGAGGRAPTSATSPARSGQRDEPGPNRPGHLVDEVQERCDSAAVDGSRARPAWCRAAGRRGGSGRCRSLDHVPWTSPAPDRAPVAAAVAVLPAELPGRAGPAGSPPWDAGALAAVGSEGSAALPG